MKSRRSFIGSIVTFAGLWTPVILAASDSDLISPQKRQDVIHLAEGLTRPAAGTTATEVANPFNPAEFDRVETLDQKEVGHGEPIVPSDREVLETLAQRIPVTGTIERAGKRVLAAGAKQFGVGQVVTVSNGGRDYDFEIVAIQPTTFTLRYHGLDFTRPTRASK